MNLISEILVYFIFCISICYALLILIFNFSWFHIKTFSTSLKNVNTKLSVILPVRNETENIIQCLEKIYKQNYPAELFEIIVVDDSSTDNTVELVNSFIRKNNLIKITLIELSKLNLSSKKQAIAEAVKVAEGDIIVTTDADCIMQPYWLKTIAEFYEKHKPEMIIGPVCFYNEKNIFQKMQSLEFLSLIASGAASSNLGFPIMCNGANLAYEKSAFIKLNGYNLNDKYSSGDDVFLMHQIKNKLKGKIVFLKNYDALVQTQPQQTFSSFLNQRKRWVSKSHGYSDIPTILIALLVFLFNTSIVFTGIFSIFFLPFLNLFLFIFVLKIIIDFPLLTGISAFMKNKKLMLYYIPLQLIYPIYIFISGAMGLFGKYEWKNRLFISKS
ncbi:MAG TPA: glycosyltransferase [Bacteroidales bacterium]|nr:glycosyltransferase [Bacteroidales bacterium]HPS18408.1 glycosyltransferase [Bacteroidales bacterium]